MCAAPLFAGDVYYVQSLKAKVMSGPSLKSDVIGEADKGQSLESTGREGNWVKVKHGSKEGYVPALLLSTRPPLERQGLISGEEAEIKAGVRRRASTFASAAAARGLTAEDRKRLGKEEKVNYEAIEKMESFRLSAEEVIKFMEGGKI